jgi:hypothetical protein
MELIELNDPSDEAFVAQEVTYTLEVDGRFVVVEHVPARVSVRTGERFFAPATVEQLQKIIWENQAPARVVETPVFDYPAAAASR